MPPIYTADDASDASDGIEDVIPAKGSAKPADEEMNNDDDDEEVAEPDNDDQEAALGGEDDKEPENDDDEEDGSEIDEYTVEKIIKHAFSEDGTPLYEIKWQGYESVKDRTWEPEANLTGAAEILNAYHKKIGGRPTPPAPKTPASKTKGRGKRKSEAVENTPEVQTSTRGRKRTKTNGEAKTPAEDEKKMPEGSWEDIVQNIDSIEQYGEKHTKGSKPSRNLRVWLHFNDSRKLTFEYDLVRQKCPLKLLDYYEQRLKFVTDESGN